MTRIGLKTGPGPVVMVDEFQLWGVRAPRPFHKGSSHLTVDDESDEHIDALHALAQRIGLRRDWYQPKSTPHYDLVESRRTRALKAGAVFVPSRDQALARLARRRASPGRLNASLARLSEPLPKRTDDE